MDDVASRTRKVFLECLRGPEVPYARDATIVHLFEARAAEEPHKLAIIFGATALTYRELDEKANTVAAFLSDAGAGHGDITPLLVGNTPAAPIVMLALMKLSAVFVPLDETWPESRISLVLSEVAPKVIVASPELVPLISTANGTVVSVAWETVSQQRKFKPNGRPSVDDLIYGFFTSGSTGKPKCAMNAHIGLLNRFLTMSRRFEADGKVVLQNSSNAFDSSIWQLLWPLTTGGTVVIPLRDGILDISATLEIIHREKVTMTDFVPSIFNTLVRLIAADPALVGQLASLRRLLIGGETISPRAVHVFRQLAPQVRLTNTYGPTECSIGSVWHEINDDTEPIPIGRPIDNTFALVLDDHGQLVGPEESGEVYIGGDCVGRGYLNDAEKTQSAFVPNTFPGFPGTLLYRTGDIGYARADGVLYFVGRRDDQVKLGGVRLELSEIERAFTSHNLVVDAKVIVIGEHDARQLIAFVVSSRNVVPAELRHYIASLLPAPGVPKHVIQVQSFPLSINGKIDRLALTAMASAALEASNRTRVEPGNDIEYTIHRIWTEVLERPSIDVTESFFECGGDSLKAHRLTIALCGVFGRTLGVREVVAHPTIRDLAALCMGAQPRVAIRLEERLRADVVLADHIRRAVSPARSNTSASWTPGTILLTGATGFIGVHLLHELIARTSARVICLVRASDTRRAQRRLAEAIDRYHLSDPLTCTRVEVLRGDLATHQLGLDASLYNRLGQTVDSIVHCGAMVNLLLDYRTHRQANVVGTIELLQLAALGKPKHFHFMSTLSVFPPAARTMGIVREVLEPSESAIPLDGYSQSKWVAEKLLGIAAERGISSNTYRMGEVGPHSQTGVPSERGLIDKIMRACLKYGIYFDTSVSVDYTPVDSVSAIIAEAVRRGYQQKRFHVIQPASLSLAALFTAIARRTAIRRVSYGQFWHALHQGDTSTDNDLILLLSLLPKPTDNISEEDRQLLRILTNATGHFASDATDRLRKEARIGYPSLAESLDRYAEECTHLFIQRVT